MILYAHPWHYGISAGVYFLTGCFGMSMTYHRLLSHQAWRAPKWFEPIGLFLGTYGLTGSSISWVAIHRQHHAYTDEPLDPHSPHSAHPLRAHFFSMIPRPRLGRYARDLVQSPLHRTFHRKYWYIHVGIALGLLAIEPLAVVYAYLFPAMVLWNGGSAVNSIGHLFGYRNFSTKDFSRNNFILGFITWGEGWHNNHHHQPRNPLFNKKWWEFDMAGVWIKLLRRDARQVL